MLNNLPTAFHSVANNPNFNWDRYSLLRRNWRTGRRALVTLQYDICQRTVPRQTSVSFTINLPLITAPSFVAQISLG